MGVLTSPLEDLSEEEQVIAEHLIDRLKEVEAMFDTLHHQTEQLNEGGKRVEEISAVINHLDENGEAADELSDAAVRLAEEAKRLDDQSRLTAALLEQAQTVYDFYVEVAHALESDGLSVNAAAERIIDVEERIEWLESDDDLAELVQESSK